MDGTNADGSSNNNSNYYEPRKRKRGPYKRNGVLTDLYEHFTTLDEKRTSSVGKQSFHFLCVCNYCQSVYLEALQLHNRRYPKLTSNSPPPPPTPKKLTRCTRDCEGHLRNCNAYRSFCMENNIVPYGQVNDEKKHIVDERLPPSVALEVAAAIVAAKKIGGGAQVAPAPKGAAALAPPVATSAAAAPAPVLVKIEPKVSGSKSKTIIPRVPKLPHVDPRFEPLLLEFLVDNDLPLQAVERPSFARLMEAVTAGCGGSGYQLNFYQLIPSCARLRDVALASANTSLTAMQSNLGIEFNRGFAPAMIVKTRMVPIITACSTTLSQGKQHQELSLSPQRMRLVHVIDSVLLKAGNATLTLNIYADPSIKSTLFKQQDGMGMARVWENLLLNKEHHHCASAATVAATPTPTGDTHASAAALSDQVNDEDYFRYFLSEDIGNCSLARNILALRHPSMLWLRCWVHQLHAMVQKLLHAAVLKQLTFRKVCTQAIKAAHTIQASATSSPTDMSSTCNSNEKSNATAATSLALQLEATVNSMYEAKTWTGVFTANASNGWSCMQACFASQLCIRDACVTLARDLSSIEIENKDDFESKNESPSPAPKRAAIPMALHVWKDVEYWEELQDAESLIRPFCEASFLLQAPQANTLAHVMFMLLSLYSKLQSYCAFHGEDEGSGGPTPTTRRGAWRQLAEILMSDIEERWEKEDNPLFFLAFALHPYFRNVAVGIVKKSSERDGSWNSGRNPLSVSRLVSAAKFYYAKHKLHQASSSVSSSSSPSPPKVADCPNHELALLGKRIHQWLSGRAFAGVSPFLPQQENAVEWWEENKFEYPQISRLAIFLLDAPIQASPDCNTLFQQQSQDNFPPTSLSPTNDREEQHQHPHHNDQTFYMRQLIRDEMKCRYAAATTTTATNPCRRTIIDATEFKKLTTKQQEENNDAFMHQERPPSPLLPPVVDKEETTVDSEDHNNNIVVAVDDENEGETEIEYWLRILESVLPNRPQQESNKDKKKCNSSKNNNMEEEDLMESDNEEDLPEVALAPSKLPPLPMHDDDDDDGKSYPREGPRYFSGKNYVRKDKYPLAKLLQGHVELPSLASIYSGTPSSL